MFVFFSKPAFSEQINKVRVNILSKFKPTELIVYQKNKHNNKLLINRDSVFPIYLSSSPQYTIKIPKNNIKRSYHGMITVYKEKERLVIVNTVPIEKYVKSVVLSEMGLKHKEAMRAQSVLARTWAVKNIRPKHRYDFNDLTNSQVYKGIFDNVNLNDDVLSQTNSQLLTYNKKPIKVFYHSDCANRSYSAYEIWGINQYPYYKRINFPDELKSRQPRKWLRKIKKTKINNIFKDVIEPHASFLYKRSSEQGRVGVYINNHWIDVDTFRIKINRVLGWNQLRSNHFSLSEQDGFLIFKGVGFGHLIGLCQKSAIVLADKGWLYPRILDLFYPGTKLFFLDKQTLN